jgi:YHS domain-containing protein
MDIGEAGAAATIVYAGTKHAFCPQRYGCRKKFEQDPKRFARDRSQRSGHEQQ